MSSDMLAEYSSDEESDDSYTSSDDEEEDDEEGEEGAEYEREDDYVVELPLDNKLRIRN